MRASATVAAGDIGLADGAPLIVSVADSTRLDCGTGILRQTSIVIPVRDDLRIFACLESIRGDIGEIVIVANGSPPAFRRMLRRFLGQVAQIVFLEEPGIGPAYNAGIRAATGQYIMLMDSDCTFDEDTLRHMAVAIGKGRLVKGRVEFSVSGLSSRLTAKARAVLEDPLQSRRASAYSPPLLYDRDLVDEMGGYHFCNDLAWREDREFELRRRAAGIPVVLAPDATIRHAPLSASSDLRSVYRYGRGEAMGRALGLFPREAWPVRLRKTIRTARRILCQERMPAVMLYFLCRRLAFNLGHARQRWSLSNAAPAPIAGRLTADG